MDVILESQTRSWTMVSVSVALVLYKRIYESLHDLCGRTNLLNFKCYFTMYYAFTAGDVLTFCLSDKLIKKISCYILKKKLYRFSYATSLKKFFIIAASKLKYCMIHILSGKCKVKFAWECWRGKSWEITWRMIRRVYVTWIYWKGLLLLKFKRKI